VPAIAKAREMPVATTTVLVLAVLTAPAANAMAVDEARAGLVKPTSSKEWNLPIPTIHMRELGSELRDAADGSGTADQSSHTGSSGWTSSGGCDHLLLPMDISFDMPSSILDAACPLIIDLHGYGQDGTSQFYSSGFRSRVATHRVWPTGYPVETSGYAWNAGHDTYPPASTLNIQHVAQLDRIICYALCKHNVSGVFLAGLSNGAAMAQRLGRESSHVIDGIIAVSHPIVPTLDANASSSRPVPIILLAGTLDEIWGNERVMNATVDSWRLYNGCAAAEEADVHDDLLTPDLDIACECEGNVTIRTQRFRSCTSPVTYKRLIGAGHVFPGELFAGEEVDAMLAPRGVPHRVGVGPHCRTFASPSTINAGTEDSGASQQATEDVGILVGILAAGIVIISVIIKTGFLINKAKQKKQGRQSSGAIRGGSEPGGLVGGGVGGPTGHERAAATRTGTATEGTRVMLESHDSC